MNYQDRFAKQGTIAAGDDAYYETYSGYRSSIVKGKVTRVTKTLVDVEVGSGKLQTTYTFRWQPSYDRYTNKDRYEEMKLVTEETYTNHTLHEEREKATNAARNAVRGAWRQLEIRGQWVNAKDIDEAVEILQEQAKELRRLAGE